MQVPDAAESTSRLWLQEDAADLTPDPQLSLKRRRGKTVSVTHLDLREWHADPRELNADVVRPPVLHQQNLVAPRLGQPPQCCVLQDLQMSTEQRQSTLIPGILASRHRAVSRGRVARPPLPAVRNQSLSSNLCGNHAESRSCILTAQASAGKPHTAAIMLLQKHDRRHVQWHQLLTCKAVQQHPA